MLTSYEWTELKNACHDLKQATTTLNNMITELNSGRAYSKLNHQQLVDHLDIAVRALDQTYLRVRTLTKRIKDLAKTMPPKSTT